MSTGTPLSLETDFFGVDEAITNYSPGCREFVATLIFPGGTPEAVEEKRKACFQQIRENRLT